MPFTGWIIIITSYGTISLIIGLLCALLFGHLSNRSMKGVATPLLNCFHKRTSHSVLFSIVFLLCFGMLTIIAVAAGKDTEADITSDQRISQEVETPWVTNEETIQIAEKYFFTDDDIQYYAYLNYDEAEEELKPVILTARLHIIYQHSWAADGIKGRVFNKDGTLEYEVPEFHDLFPADWDEPIHGPTEVDLEYYGIYE